MKFVALLVFSLALTASATDADGTKWLAENKEKPGVITTESGLQYKILTAGSGAHHPTANSPCEVHYEGTLINGEEFDSSYKRGTPTTFAPNQVGTQERLNVRRAARHRGRSLECLSDFEPCAG